MNSQTTRRPRIGLVRLGVANYTAVEVLNSYGNLIGYSNRVNGPIAWSRHAPFTPLAEVVPEPRMDEPQETWATVVAKTAQHPLDVFIHTHDGTWRRCLDNGFIGLGCYAWSDLIDPRLTTPTERATGIVGGEDQ